MLGVLVPVAAGFGLHALGWVPPFSLTSETIGTLWQVEGAVVGLGIALAIYGYESLARSGPIAPEDLASLALPRGIYLGLALLILTGAAYLVAPSGNLPGANATADPWTQWIGLATVVVALIWAVILIRALPEIVAVSDTNFRNQLRLKRLTRLAKQSAERRLVEIASFTILLRYVQSGGGEWTPWYGEQEVEANTFRFDAAGYVADVHVGRLQYLFAAYPGLRTNLRLHQSVRQGQFGAVARDTPTSRDRAIWKSAVYVRQQLPAAELERVIEDLRDDAARAVGVRAAAVTDVLNAFEAALQVFAEKWERHLGPMAAEDLQEPLRPDQTPLGLVIRATSQLMVAALRAESREAVRELGFFPTRLARIGLERRSTAYLSALALCRTFYAHAVANADSREVTAAKGTWLFVAEFRDIVLPALASDQTIGVADAMLREADVTARRSLVGVARQMITAGDLDEYRKLLQRLSSGFDD